MNRPGVSPNPLAAGPLDRAPERRRDAAWLADRLLDPESRILPVWRSRNLVTTGDTPTAVRLSPDAIEIPDDGVGAIFLGLEGSAACFAVDLSALDDPLATLELAAAEFADLRRIGARLGQAEGALLAYARGMAHWHGRHLFCGRCGSETKSTDGGHVRRCVSDDCQELHFPRTDPAIIVLVRDEDSCLLGRRADWPTGMFSTLAGFIEPGESAGEAVAREVREEVGVTVRSVRYHSSQPWPFPSSLMLGFMADADRVEPVLDADELAEARWFRREELRQRIGSGRVRLPPPISIARRLIEDWLEGPADG